MTSTLNSVLRAKSRDTWREMIIPRVINHDDSNLLQRSRAREREARARTLQYRANDTFLKADARLSLSLSYNRSHRSWDIRSGRWRGWWLPRDYGALFALHVAYSEYRQHLLRSSWQFLFTEFNPRVTISTTKVIKSALQITVATITDRPHVTKLPDPLHARRIPLNKINCKWSTSPKISCRVCNIIDFNQLFRERVINRQSYVAIIKRHSTVPLVISVHGIKYGSSSDHAHHAHE